LRLRLLKTDKIDEAQFHISSLQDEQSEIILSSGNISVDLLHRQRNLEEKGNNEAFSSYLDKPYSLLYPTCFGLVLDLVPKRVIIIAYSLKPNHLKT